MLPARAVAAAKRRIRADLRTDPLLPYIIGLAVLLSGFWFWHRIPNFATRDERDRLLDPLVAIGRVLADPGFDSLQEGVLWGREHFGATFYLFGLALLPALLAAAVLGDLGAVAGLGFPSWQFGHVEAWRSLPEWFWTLSIATLRIFNICFAVGSVYLTYRLGRAMRGRATGRLAAINLTLMFGFLMIAHEGGEDVPALFFLLLSLYLAYRYIQTGHREHFIATSATGGVAIAFKLTVAPIVFLIGLAFVLRGWQAEDWRSALLRPRLFLTGAIVGLVAIVLGFPSALVGGIEPLQDRLVESSLDRPKTLSGPSAPFWWWALRGYFSGLGLPMFLAAVAGVGAAFRELWTDSRDTEGTILLLVALTGFLVVLLPWNDFRPHHLLPTFPVLALLVARGYGRLRSWNPSVARPLLAALLLTSGAYAAVGVGGYANMPRDQAADWLETNAEPNATLEVYRTDFQDAVVPHDRPLSTRYNDFNGSDTCAEYIEITYREHLAFLSGPRFTDNPRKESYLASLMDGEYNYTRVAKFGPRPTNRPPDRPTPGSLTEIIPLGVIPQTDQYSDEQELAVNQYTAFYRRTGPCGPTRRPPF